MIRPLELGDYNKNFIYLLNQLTNKEKSGSEFLNFSQQFYLIKQNPNHHCYVMTDLESGLIIATGTLLIEPKFIHHFSFVGHLEDIVVDNKYQGQGLGKKMIKYLIRKAQKCNCYKIILSCSEETKQFYYKCGLTQKKNNLEMSFYFN